ncbi:acetyl-CoA carboxylase biotin carboxyl carrier protein [Listeria kieliensis]|uniref:Biotin carboxyl carrier protein of acetyl-CoA carboxylase n=1 Tax=Listeria kieliensis TaxID=1621700 RepID=A0A3D8TV81_9LIST|nr:acetyl-CoA carboxylase biotin carboxyl carrier protein [Listeria kieliensis]RDX02900.1 acetyl-CoA carboxylase [Listeria kieliensis]
MLSFDEIKQLIQLIDESNLDELKLEVDDTKIHLQKNSGAVTVIPQKQSPVAVPAVEAASQVTETAAAAPVQTSAAESTSEADLEVITSPMVGTFYAAGSPDDAPYVQVGSKVSASTVVCVVEAMKLFNDITADVNGEIAEILVSNGELVEYGQPLFKVRKQ